MTKNEIQEQRMRGYFIEATRELLKAEGLKSVSVRSIAEKAGYSYATLYNYFRDVKELVFECVRGFSEECVASVVERTASIPPGEEGLRARLRAWALYFAEYPGVFELFYLERLNDLGNRHPSVNIIWTLPDRLCAADWERLGEEGLPSSRAHDLMEAVKYEITGMLLFYLNRGKPSRFDGFAELLDARIAKTLTPPHHPLT
ncbi:MAG TPA: TetR/AcrR family transcriptional regulator [Bacteroidales bacterium]|nr:TetR/AcrR family transcriptional regulator [Bacteroidales bacterium]